MVFLFWMVSLTAYAGDETICGVLVRPNDVLECAKSKAPEAERLQAEKESVELDSEAALRWSNPEFSNQSLFTQSRGLSSYQLQFGLLQSFELGERRSYKNALARSLEKRANAQYQLELGELLQKTGINLLKLSHLEQEIKSLEEGLETFNRLIRQFESRPRLAPEQEVSLSVYRLSQSDFLLRKSKLLDLQDEIRSHFNASLGLSKEQLQHALLTRAAALPEIKSPEFLQTLNPSLKLQEADVLFAQANLSLARSDPFSDIRFGPLIQLENDGGEKRQFFGFQLTFPFPILNQNEYGVESAVRKIKSAEIQSVLTQRNLQEDWGRLLKRYERLKVLLAQLPSTQALESRHQKTEEQIYRGLVNSALVVEAHRSFVDFQKNRHETELEAWETYCKILISQGKISEIRL